MQEPRLEAPPDGCSGKATPAPSQTEAPWPTDDDAPPKDPLPGNDEPPPESGQGAPAKLAAILEARRFKPGIEPPPLRPIYTLAGSVISTPGNLTSITGGPKVAKTAVVGAMMAAPMVQAQDIDTLGFSSTNPKGLAIVHADSEQAPDDFWHAIARAVRRAGLKEPPPWLFSYCLTGLGHAAGWLCVKEALKRAADQCAGIHSGLLDGVADLIGDPNDPAESNDFVAELHGLAILYDCPIAGVIHFNPGGEKTRGHLGSQLERKSETNLRLDKDNGVTTIWSDKQRRAPIPKGTGPCFEWSEKDQMHVTAQNYKAAAEKEERDRLTLLADDLFQARPGELFQGRGMLYTELVTTAKNRLAVAERTAARRIERLSELGIIRKGPAGLYTKAT